MSSSSYFRVWQVALHRVNKFAVSLRLCGNSFASCGKHSLAGYSNLKLAEYFIIIFTKTGLRGTFCWLRDRSLRRCCCCCCDVAEGGFFIYRGLRILRERDSGTQQDRKLILFFACFVRAHSSAVEAILLTRARATKQHSSSPPLFVAIEIKINGEK